MDPSGSGYAFKIIIGTRIAIPNKKNLYTKLTNSFSCLMFTFFVTEVWFETEKSLQKTWSRSVPWGNSDPDFYYSGHFLNRIHMIMRKESRKKKNLRWYYNIFLAVSGLKKKKNAEPTRSWSATSLLYTQVRYRGGCLAYLIHHIQTCMQYKTYSSRLDS